MLPLRTLAERALGGLVLIAVVVLPLIFVPSLDDAYALPKAAALRVFGLAAASLFLGYVVLGGSLARYADRRVDLPLVCLAGLLVAASIASVDPGQSFVGEPYQYQGVVTGLLYIGSFYVARLFLGSAVGFRMLLAAIVWTGAVVSVYGIAQGLGFDPFWPGPPDDGRVISSVGQANSLAAYLDLVIVAALGLWPAAQRWSRLGLGALVVASLVALALTFSRGGYLGLAVAVALMVVPGHVARPSRRVGAVGLALAAGLLAVTIALPPARAIVGRVADRAAATFDAGEGSIRFHLDLWRVGSRIALDHPWIGTGPETFPVVFRPYLDQVLPPDRVAILGRFRLESPHNELIGIAAEMGLPALIAYLAFLGACAVTCVRCVRAAGGASSTIALVVLATLAAHVVTNFFMTPEVTTSEIFWIVTGAGLAAMRPTAPGTPTA